LFLDNSKIYQHFFNNYGYKDYNINFNIDIENSLEEKYNVDINTSVYLENDYDESLLNYKYNGKDKITYLNKKGSKLGSVSIYYDDELISTVDVKLNKDIKYETKAYTLPIFIIIIVIIILTFIILKKILKKKKKYKIKTNIKYNKVSVVMKENKENIKNFIKEENSDEKKLKILKSTIDINLFFDTLKYMDNIDKEQLEKNLIDRCFENINFKDIEELKELYTKLKLYKDKMNEKTIKYYNKLFKYCVEEYIGENKKIN